MEESMNNLKRISAVILAAVAVGCASSVPRQESYAINAKVSSNGVVLGEPALLVEQGTTATVAVDGAGGYELEVNVRPATTDSDQALVGVELTTGGEEISSTLVVELGEPATVSVDDVDLVLLVRPATTQNSRTRTNSTSLR
jgi:hypothetical protein